MQWEEIVNSFAEGMIIMNSNNLEIIYNNDFFKK